MLTILAIIFLLGILILGHETGHFIIARLCKVKVEKFSFGFGPKLLSFTAGETEYRLSLIPLGGYVKMLGENPDETEEISERSFQQKKWWQKGLIAVGGPFANFIIAILILSITFMIGIKNYDFKPIIGVTNKDKYEELGKFQKGDCILEVDNNEIDSWMSIIKTWMENPHKMHHVTLRRDDKIIYLKVQDFDYHYWLSDIKPYASAEIGEVLYGLPAYQAGLKKNDTIIAINDKPISNWYDMQNIIQKNSGNTLTFTIERDSKIVKLQVIPQANPDSKDNAGIIGISQKLDLISYDKYNFVNSVKYGVLSTISITYRYCDGIIMLFKHPSQLSKNLGGPIMIAALSGQQAKEGWSTFLSFMAMISIILMVVNLLPIPILDGGLVLFAIIEGIMRKPLKASVQALLQRIGVAIIFTLVILAFYNDISHFITRQFSLKKDNVPAVLEK